MAVYRGVVTIENSALGGTGTNTWHVRAGEPDGAGPTNLQDAEDVLEAFYAGVETYLGPTTTVAHDGVWTVIDDNSLAQVSVDPWSHGNVGSGSSLPPQECLVVGWRTLSGGRSGRGRTFLGPLSDLVLQDNGTPTEDSRAGVVAAADALIAESGGPDGWAFVVWSETDSLARDFVSGAVRNVFGSLRSRRD